MLSEACEGFARSKTFRFEETCVDSAPFKGKKAQLFSFSFFSPSHSTEKLFLYLVDAFIPSDFQSKSSQFYVFPATPTLTLALLTACSFSWATGNEKMSAYDANIYKPTWLYNRERHCSDLMELRAVLKVELQFLFLMFSSFFDACFCTSQRCQWCILLHRIWQTALCFRCSRCWMFSVLLHVVCLFECASALMSGSLVHRAAGIWHVWHRRECVLPWRWWKNWICACRTLNQAVSRRLVSTSLKELCQAGKSV